ncbi:MAG: LysR family transcriptional regulator [Proteobacteria bacterium]|jgi:DNA-binding transcriptional LysR family regulator|nr:LysR family transcriptional regulator [Pseudomonadota bacterium]
MAMDLGRLRAFLEVARVGSYQVAALRLHVTPSAISHALRKLQDDLGCELVDWRGRRFALTAAGEDLFHTCQQVFDEIDEAERRLCAGGKEGALRVVLGSTIEFGTTVLLYKLKPLLAEHPELHVDFQFSNSLDGPLLRDEVDLVVDCRPHGHPAVHRTEMFREKYVVVAAPEFLERHAVRKPLDLQSVPVISLDTQGRWWTTLLSTLPAGRRPTFGRMLAIDHVRGMVNATLAGYGVGLLPKYALLPELERGALTVLFPRLRLLEDTFCIYQKVARLARPGNRALTDLLTRMNVSELGDAIGTTVRRRVR